MTHVPTHKPARALRDRSLQSSSGTTAPLSDAADSARNARTLLHWVFPSASTVVLRQKLISLGRGVEADVTLHSEAVSRKHAELAPAAGGGFELRDLKSRNGVFVNAVRQSQVRLQLGDVVRLADHVGIVLQAEANCSLHFEQVTPGVWGSGVLERTLSMAHRAAPTGLPVLVLGESGTGKEAIARAIHEHSARPGRLVPINCAALSENLLEAELFGHERGAFSGAHVARPGYVQWANGGTLFLDEISELSAAAQAKLLRVIQEGEVHAIGTREPQRVDVRVIAATHQDLAQRVSAGHFRLDLYQRLAGITLRLPALRERPTDILPLFEHFAREQGGYRERAAGVGGQLCERLVETLCLYPWPGNVRELQRIARATAALHAAEPRWRRSHLPAELRRAPESAPVQEAKAEEPVPRTQRVRARPSELHDDTIRIALRAAGGNIASAARALSISRQSLYDLLKLRGIERDPER